MWNRLEEYGISQRPTGAPQKYPRRPISKKRIPYIQGFIEGDLSEEVVSNKTRRKKGGSSRPEFIEHVRQLFSPYGHVGVSKRQHLVPYGKRARYTWIYLDKGNTEVLSKSTGRTREWVTSSHGFSRGLPFGKHYEVSPCGATSFYKAALSRGQGAFIIMARFIYLSYLPLRCQVNCVVSLGVPHT